MGAPQMERIEVRDITSQELLSRVKMCEDALSAINHEKLSPFNQQEILTRLDELETRVREAEEATTQNASPRTRTNGTWNGGARIP